MKLALGVVVGVVLAVVTGLVADLLAPEAQRRKKLVWSVFVGLIPLAVAIAYLPDEPPMPTQEDSSSLVASGTPSQTPYPDCSTYIELGPWDAYGNVLVDARDGWVQADFWSPRQTLIEGYDEVSVIFQPTVSSTTVSGRSTMLNTVSRST